MLKDLLRDPHYRVLKQKKIGVLMGGRSAEREVSLRSGRGALTALQRLGLDAVGIDAASRLEEKLAAEKVGIAFLALHGRWGEDGIVQGLLEYLNIPYTGSGVHASALAMNKVSSKQIFRACGIPTLPFGALLKKDGEADVLANLKPVGFPLFLKPFDEGSSLGCYLIKKKSGFLPTLRRAWRDYPRMFAEKYIRGPEFSVGVLDIGGRPTVLPVLELAPKRVFYDYAAKYREGLTDFIIPPQRPPRLLRRLSELALRAHQALNAHGFSRTDLLVDLKNQSPYVLELNTIPGLTALSDFPAQARALGLTYDHLVYHMLVSALTARRSLRKAIYDD